MRILLIAYSFPPLIDGQSFRWYYLSNALADLGIKIDVLTIRQPFEDKGAWNFHKNIEVFRNFPGPVEFFALRAKNSIGAGAEGNREIRKSARFKIMKSLYWGIRSLGGNLFPGDIRTEWLPFAIRFINQNMDMKQYDYLITSHEPWVDSLLGLYLKRRHGEIRWVADFGDPYVALYTPGHKLWFENYLEKWIYQNASALIFTNHKVIDHLIHKYPFLRDKPLWVMEQGFDARVCTESESRGSRNKVFTLFYAGTFYRDFRNPSNLIKALSMLDFEYKFRLAGRNEKFMEDFRTLGNRFEFLGLVDHFRVLRLEKESDVLVHLANKNSSIQIPGKFYEYLGALKPILAIHDDPQDPTKQIVQDLNVGVASQDNPLEIKTAIEFLYRRWTGSENRCPLRAEGIYPYSWEERARILYGNLGKI